MSELAPNQEEATTTLGWVVRRKWFWLGYLDRVEGQPPRKEYETLDGQQQGLYEAGRLFGCVYHGPVRQGGKVSPDVYRALHQALEDGVYPCIAF